MVGKNLGEILEVLTAWHKYIGGYLYQAVKISSISLKFFPTIIRAEKLRRILPRYSKHMEFYAVVAYFSNSRASPNGSKISRFCTKTADSSNGDTDDIIGIPVRGASC